MNYLNILHLSDLHLKPEGTVERYNQSRVLDALVDSVRDLANGQYRPDLLIFSGDLVNAADDNLFGDASAVIESIRIAAELDDGRVLICSGNHDASRNAIGPAIPLIKNFRLQANTLNGANELSLSKAFVAHVGNVFGSINSVHKKYSSSSVIREDFLTRTHLFARLGVGIVTVNSAALSGAGLTPDLDDERQLVISEMLLDQALKALPGGILKIVVGHHPLSFLNEVNEIAIKSILQKHSSAYFSGHTHRKRPEFVTSPLGTTSYIQAGSLYASRDWWNGYGLVSMDIKNPSSPRILYKKWQEDRLGFGLATELSDDGVVYASDEAKAHWAAVKVRPAPGVWEKWRTDHLLPFMQAECKKDLSRVFEEGRFIQPEFERDRYVGTDQGIERAAQPQTVALDEIVSGHNNLVIFATAESGKTTLLREWARRLCSEDATSPDWKIPIILRFSEIKNYKSAIERLVKQRLPDLPNGVSHIDLLTSGKLVVLVDDVRLASIREDGGFAEFANKYPDNRYILLTSTVYLQGAGIAPVIVEEMKFDHLRAKNLRTSQVLALIESHGMKDPAEADRLLQRMMVEASSLNVPITPVTGSFLIQIYTEDSASTLVNKANLVERYIEISLEKFAPTELLPSSFDFRNKTDLLSYVAEKMARLGIFSSSEANFVSWINEYLAEYGLRFSTLDLISYFVEARILERSDGMISFRLNAFFEYFVAVRMSEDENFRGYALGEENYLSFSNEISFYAALSRKDDKWLTELLSRFKKHSSEAKRGSLTVSAASILEGFTLPSATASVEDLRKIEDKAFAGAMSEEERRSALDDDLPVIDLPAKPVSRASISSDSGHRWMAQLTMLSSTLKNMELISSAKKKEVLGVVIESWLEFIAMSMMIVPELAERRRLRFGGVEYIVVFPDDMDAGELAQRLYMYMPISTAKIASFHVGTEKLRVQLEDGIGLASEEPAAAQLFRGAILAQLGVDGLPAILKSVAESIVGKRYLEEVFFRLLAEVVVRYRLPERERQSIKALAADVRVRLEGATGSNAKRRKSAVMTALGSTRLKVQIANKEPASLPGNRG